MKENDKFAKMTEDFAKNEMTEDFAKNGKDDIKKGIGIKENLKEKEEQTKVWEGYNSDKSKDKKKNIENEKISLSSEKMATRFTSATLELVRDGLDKGINKAEQKQNERQKSESLETLSNISTNDESLNNKKQDNKQNATSHNLSSITTSDDTMPIVAKKTGREQTNSR